MTIRWDSEKVYLNGDEYFRHIIEDIEKAENSVTLEFYIFNDDVLGRALGQVLTEAAERGVKVQMIVDGIGSYDFIRRMYPQLMRAKVEIKIYNPLPFVHPYYGNLSFRQKLQALGMRFIRMNKRDHRKIITIDESIMYAGSFNVTAEHTRFFKGTPWKDMGLRVTGQHVQYAVLHFKRGFKLREYLAYRKKVKGNIPHWKSSPMMLNTTIFMKHYYQKQFLSNLKSSRETAWLMTPYFIPSRRFIKAMAKAAKRGVDVRLILSAKTDVDLFLHLQMFYYPFLIKSGVKIYQYTKTVLHAKTYVFDEWVSVGSSNLNHRSMMHDLEVDLAVQEKENIKTLKADFEDTMRCSLPLDKSFLNQRSFLDRFLTQLFFIFRYWL